MTGRRQAVEGKMLGHLGMTEEARVLLAAHNERQTDWHGWCQRCRTHLTGAIASLSRACPVCGHGGEGGKGGKDG